MLQAGKIKVARRGHALLRLFCASSVI